MSMRGVGCYHVCGDEARPTGPSHHLYYFYRLEGFLHLIHFIFIYAEAIKGFKITCVFNIYNQV